MRYRIRHITKYKYAQRVTRCYNLANVVPRDTIRQRCISNRVTISPQPAAMQRRTDYFGNLAYHFEIQKPHAELVITADSEVQITEGDPAFNLDLGASYGEVLEHLRLALDPDTI